MSKILWLSDYILEEAPGGAQRSDSILMEEGLRRGNEITHAYNKNFQSITDFNDFDILVSSNIELLFNLDKNLINKISEHKNHVRVEHDSNTYLSQEDRVKLFSNCRKTIFLTEFHKSFFIKKYGNIFRNVEIIPDPIDTSIFNSENRKDHEGVLYAGYLHALKGAYEFFDFALSHPKTNFYVAGWASTPALAFLAKNVPNIEDLGLVEHKEMARVYKDFKYLFYSPNLLEPFCRTLAEAVLCGMQIICNKQHQIGCLTEINRLGIEEFKKRVGNAHNAFWDSIVK